MSKASINLVVSFSDCENNSWYIKNKEFYVNFIFIIS